MKEETMRRVMIKYFKSKGIKVVPQRGAGPDLHIKGKAVEVKGSRYDFGGMLRQVVDYAKKYSAVELALPFDGLTLEKARLLAILSNLIEDFRDMRLKVYVVVPDLEGKNLFYVREFKQAFMIVGLMGSVSTLELGFDPDNPDSTIYEAVENLIKYSFVNNLKGTVSNMLSARETSKIHI